MIMVHFQKHHGLAAAGTFKRVITEGMQSAVAPAVEGENEFMFFSGNGGIKLLGLLFCSGIETIVTNLLEVFFRDMLNKAMNELHDRNGFDNKFFVFVAIVMEGDIFAIVIIDA